MSKYRKRPVVIEAHQWHSNGDHPLDAEGRSEFNPETEEGRVVRRYRHPQIAGDELCGVCSGIVEKHGWVDTLEAGHRVCPGDWIITGVEGEHYPCKPRIFAATYEAV